MAGTVEQSYSSPGDRPKIRRLDWVDYAKSIGIFWVVVGHVLRGLFSSNLLEPSALTRFIDQWIYAFHMPLFFFLSGLFLVRSAAKPFKVFWLDKLGTIAYPYFLWSLLQGLLQIAAAPYTHQQVKFSDLGRIAYEPIQQFWFLYTLFVILLLYGVIHKVFQPLAQRRSPLMPVLIFLGLAVSLYGAQVSNISFGNWGVLYLIRQYAIYTALGALVGSLALDRLGRIKPPVLIGAALGGYWGVAAAVSGQLNQNGWLIPAIALLGSAASVAIALLLAQFEVLRFVQSWGIFSLEIFVVHTIVIAITRIGLQKLGMRDPEVHLCLEVAVGLYLPMALAMMGQRAQFPYLFRWGDRRVKQTPTSLTEPSSHPNP